MIGDHVYNGVTLPTIQTERKANSGCFELVRDSIWIAGEFVNHENMLNVLYQWNNIR